jgi:adenine-specific DNA methylase
MEYPKRLIEVDFPLKKVSFEASREKNIRSGHIKNLHIWWARRPQTACRAILASSLWPDPCDAKCPISFVKESGSILKGFIDSNIEKISAYSIKFFNKGREKNELWKNKEYLREALLNFIAEFSSFENGQKPEFIEAARNITSASSHALNNGEDTFTVIDPFAGGGAIPLESFRLGCTTIANDLNPLPVILNTLAIKILPKYGAGFAENLQKAGEILIKLVETKIRKFYPIDDDGFEPLAYFRARTIVCEGPACGYQIPMIKKYGLSDRNGYVSVVPKVNNKTNSIDFDLHVGSKPHPLHFDGTVKRGKVVCPKCNFTNKANSVKRQLSTRNGGANDAQLFAIVLRNPKTGVRKFRLPLDSDNMLIKQARTEILTGKYILPDDDFCIMSGVFNAPIYGMDKWYKLYTDRQIIMLNTFFSKIPEATSKFPKCDKEEKSYLGICLGLIIGNLMHYNTSVSTYTLEHMLSAFIQGQAIPMKWDYAEANPLTKNLVGGYQYALNQFIDSLKGDMSFTMYPKKINAEVFNEDARNIPLPDDLIDCVFTDPPYYNSVPYADLSDLFLAWYKHYLKDYRQDLFTTLSIKDKELCMMSGWDPVRYSERDEAFYTKGMCEAFTKARIICKPEGILSIVFAHKSTTAWESLLSSVIDAGLICTASWPIDTERAARMRANKSAALASSVHLICRPRENADGSLITNKIGDWRDILKELPFRIHEWVPRLAAEGVVGADAIFSCLGPALEIYSRYSSVEKPNGDTVGLKEYLEQVWAAVSQEAISMVFDDADARSLEEDARITAMWLWTLSTNVNDNSDTNETEEDDDEEDEAPKKVLGGFYLEYDTVRKIAQGLGARLDNLKSVVEVKGDKARLLPVEERTKHLFGVDGYKQPGPRKKKVIQMDIFSTAEEEAKALQPELKVENAGKTTLDRLHQAMLLFSAGRSEALKRFLDEDGVGKEDNFWKLAQALNALYPQGTNERRWVEGVQTFKKVLGY